jgi:hypothetical protein
MANEVVNPFQTYRNARGAVLAGGSLRILQPGTSSLGTAFSDSALTIPQTVDGYVLDAFGRVQGDLRWSGLRDVEVFDTDDAFIRTDEDVVTLIDASLFAINFPSVAAMIADVTLVDGDVAETQSYLLDQKQGGARYIVTTTALLVDNYRVHDLTPAGLQAQLLDEELKNNFYVAGAAGDGTTDDSAAVQRLLDIGGDMECANGIFAVSGLTLALDARIHGSGTLLRRLGADADLLTLSGIDRLLTFDGVTLDGNLANQTALQAIAMIRSSITTSALAAFAGVTFNNVTFQNGSQNDVAAVGDLALAHTLYAFAQCNFLGGEEGTDAFDVSSVSVTEGASVTFEDCYWDLQATPTTGRPAVVTANSTFTNLGSLSISACQLILMGMELTALADSRGAIHVRGMTRMIIEANRILTPQVGGIVFGAECDTVTISQNTIDALVTALVAFGDIAAITTTAASPGNDWQIDTNQCLSGGDVAINLDGSSAGADMENCQVFSNLIDGPAAEGVLYHNMTNVDIRNNYINMEGVAFNAIEANTDGVAGAINIEGNELVGLALAIGVLDIVSTLANYVVDGNTFDDVLDGVTLTGMADVFITNNVFNELTGDLITVGSLDLCRIDGNSLTGVAVPTTFVQNTGSITSLVLGENFWAQSDSSIREIAVTGANITAGPIEQHFHVFVPTGATTIDTLTDPGIDGFMVVCQGDGVATVTFNDALGNLNLSAGTQVLTDATDTLTLVWNELNSEWNELAFSNN